ncbi:YidH family protein [Nocardia sp. NPDC051750]|uniref:YidH family protein n=1 Tax=Nocardia sp. NPDC051750 TaxID=3364325 RepID=UPI00379BED7F
MTRGSHGSAPGTTLPEPHHDEPDREPDYRFTLANERTFLAWIRTAFALLAGGVAVGQLFTGELDPVTHRILGGVCVVLAVLVAVGSFLRWRQVQAAMRRDGPLPGPVMVKLLVIGVLVAAVGCALLIGL